MKPITNGSPAPPGAHRLECRPLGAVFEAIKFVEAQGGCDPGAAADLLWDWDLMTGRVDWSGVAGSRIGFGQSDLGNDIEWWEERVHPEDIRRVRAQLARALATAEPFLCEYRFRAADESFVDVLDRGFVVKDECGRPVRMIGAMQDKAARDRATVALLQRDAELEHQRSLLQTVVDSVKDLIFAKDQDSRFILANRALQEGCGVTVGMRTSDLFDADLIEHYEQVDAQVIASGEPRVVEEIIPVRGERRLFQTVKVPWVSDGSIKGVIGVSRDITEGKSAELALKNSELLYRSILEASADCIVVLSLDGTVELVNGPGCRTMEIDAEDLLGLPWVEQWPKRARPAILSAVSEALTGKAARFNAKRPTSCGTAKWWDVVVTPIMDESGRPSRLLSICRDVTDSKVASERLKWTSEHDALTSLANRRAFQSRLQASAVRAMATGSPLGLLLLDLDHFKHVNDTLGHAAGDHLLQLVSDQLLTCIRSSDFAARLGGDEFAVIIENVGGESQLREAGEAIAARLNAKVPIAGRMISAGVSIGGALFPRDAACANELFNNADTALYALKASGRGGVRMFHRHMRDHAQQVASQLSLARVALDAQSVVPHYQPKLDLRSGELAGFEALLRWMHPTQGLQLPGTVQEAFKDYELAAKIGELVQRRVVSDIRGWLDHGVSFGRVAINAAPAEFLRDDYAERLLELLEAGRVPAECLEVEVTEHVFLERGSEYVARALNLLNRAGVRVALDDFGTGYSSLSHLRDFPVNVVKIDQSFVERMIDEEEISAIVSAVINLAESLSLEVVAEGIESHAQWQVLRQKGCTHGQGFLFGKAVSSDCVARGSSLAPAA